MTDKDNSSNPGWSKARDIAGKLLVVPSSFSVGIRMMVQDQQENGATMQPVTKYQIARLMRSPSFKAMLYYASRSLRPKYLEGRKCVTIGDMLDMYEPFDVAAMVGCYLLYRKWRKGLPPEDWGYLSEIMREESLIASQVGAMIGKVGIGASILIGTLPFLALGSLLYSHKREVRAYVKQATTKGRLAWNHAQELEKFGCTVPQISTFFLLGLGFRKDICESYAIALDDTRKVSKDMDPLTYRMKMGYIWIDAILSGLEQPSITIPGDYFPLSGERDAAIKQIEQIKQGEEHWLGKNRTDISADKTPQLFAKVEAANEEIPEQLRDIFSLEEIGKMELDAFDNLIDQIDAEAEGKPKPGSTSLSSKELSDLENMVE